MLRNQGKQKLHKFDRSFDLFISRFRTQGKSKSAASNGSKSSSGSPNSSRSSSRNSSLSPRERSGSGTASKSGKKTPPTVPKKKPNVPLVPWSKRNNGVSKVCNGWTWEGEGTEQKVHLNVSNKSFKYIGKQVLN